MKEILAVCRALSDRNRLRIVAALVTHDELCACQLTAMLAVSGATASRHLGVLLGCGVVASRKVGRWVYYRLADKGSATGEFGQVLAWLKAGFVSSTEVAADRERLRAITRCGPAEFCRRYRGRETATRNLAKVLFLCTGNSCRSQMAEGWARQLLGDAVEPCSAGIEPHGLDPRAVKVMAEAGVDISGHRSKHLDEFRDVALTAVVTVCDHAHEQCPLFPGQVKVIHAGFDDPPRLAGEILANGGPAEAQLDCYRRVRDEIRDFILTLPANIGI